LVNDPPPKSIIGLSNVSQKHLMNRLLNRSDEFVKAWKMQKGLV
jgi:hypothetical protein